MSWSRPTEHVLWTVGMYRDRLVHASEQTQTDSINFYFSNRVISHKSDSLLDLLEQKKQFHYFGIKGNDDLEKIS